MYPLRALDTIGNDGKTDWNSALMYIVNGKTKEHLEMLDGGVVRQLLDEKWRAYARVSCFCGSHFELDLEIFLHFAAAIHRTPVNCRGAFAHNEHRHLSATRRRGQGVRCDGYERELRCVHSVPVFSFN